MKSILFTPGNVKAILDNLKWQTRRPAPEYLQIYNTVTKHITSGEFDFHFDGGVGQFVKPKHKAGNILYVKEVYYAYGVWVENGLTKTGKSKYKFEDYTINIGYKYCYELSDRKPDKIEKRKSIMIGWHKRNALFMPLKAARLFLKITNVRVEKLGDISEQDAIAEGIQKHEGGYKTNYRQPDAKSYLDGYEWTAQESYKTLWESINGKGSWEKNPFVWVIEFKRIEKPVNN